MITFSLQANSPMTVQHQNYRQTINRQDCSLHSAKWTPVRAVRRSSREWATKQGGTVYPAITAALFAPYNARPLSSIQSTSNKAKNAAPATSASELCSVGWRPYYPSSLLTIESSVFVILLARLSSKCIQMETFMNCVGLNNMFGYSWWKLRYYARIH